MCSHFLCSSRFKLKIISIKVLIILDEHQNSVSPFLHHRQEECRKSAAEEDTVEEERRGGGRGGRGRGGRGKSRGP